MPSRSFRRSLMDENQLNPKYKEAVTKVVNRSPYFSLLSMEIQDIKWGTSLLEVQLEEKHLQPFGNVHGGIVASVIDAAEPNLFIQLAILPVSNLRYFRNVAC